MCARPNALGAKRLAPVSPTVVQDLTARFCCHARAKPVTPLADKVRRLKGALHRSLSIDSGSLRPDFQAPVRIRKSGHAFVERRLESFAPNVKRPRSET
jgi:hypothetical protein